MAESQKGLVGLAVGGGAAAIAAIVAVVIVLRSCSSESTAPAAIASSEAAEEAKDGMHARGTDELRALGCSTAIVMDMARALGEKAVHEGEPRYIVTCDVATGAPPPCDRAAATYFAALGGNAAGAVNVRVSQQGTAKPLCSRLYLPSGADLGAYPRVN
jgi:hypothetical protein